MNKPLAPTGNSFPDGNPKGCPPDDVPYANCEVFRLVKNDPPTKDDFATLAEQNKINDKHECECHGLSVFLERDDADFYASKYPYLGELISKGSLSPSEGKLAPTPRKFKGIDNSHSTWWPFLGIDRHVFFTIVSGD
ncbi:hypothetical protein GR215_34385 [Rhizobium leguminosarum]|uniref:hypothetical protein n=1 Tax=Rhizobium leguminosarum TaxID=384 RepID=UPI0013BB0B69|nr:hypothetical protein [Rhizobium leguminosarum]NEH46887.1 hypothetical protein [Rhizobium leguminosarum]